MTVSSRVTVGLCQFGGSLDQARNAGKAAQLVRRAAAAGAQIVCLPELANTVYMPFVNEPEFFDQAEPIEGPSVTGMRDLARETKTMIVYPFFERERETYYNSVVVIDPQGGIAGTYRKSSIPRQGLFLEGTEQYYFSPGDLPLPVIPTPWGINLGVLICYERNLPEPARVLALKGADLILIPVATVEVVRPWWELLVRAHAVFNILYVGACNKVGFESGGARDTAFFGTSLAADPQGRVIAEGNSTNDEVILFDVDPAVIAQQRERWSFFEDRRPDLYDVITLPQSAADPRTGPMNESSTEGFLRR